MNVINVCASRLAPLTICIPTVALEFTRLAHRLGLLPQPDAALAEASARAQRPLEMFFPFDPYLLRKSAARLELRISYLRWSHAAQAGLAASAIGLEQGAEEEEELADDSEASDSSSSSSSGDSDDDASDASEWERTCACDDYHKGQQGLAVWGPSQPVASTPMVLLPDDADAGRRRSRYI